jgi:hypothetical protein
MSDQRVALTELLEMVEAGWPPDIDTPYMPPFRAAFEHGWRARVAWDANQGSLDAAKALHEAVLPGWRMDALWQGGVLAKNQDVWICRLRCIAEDRHAIETDRCGMADPARAWLIAIIRAKITEEQKQ